MATKKKGPPLNLDLDPDFLRVLKCTVSTSDAYDEMGPVGLEVLKVKKLNSAVKKWKKHYRIFKK